LEHFADDIELLAVGLLFYEQSFRSPAGERVTFLCSCKEKSPKESTWRGALGFTHGDPEMLR
jgi:hypothetical protein